MSARSILAPLLLLGCSASTTASPGGGTNDGGVSNDDAGDAATADIEWIAEGGSNEKIVRIAVNGTYVAWTAAESKTVSQPSAGSVRVWPKAGGAAKSVWSGAGDVNAIAADETAVYWLVAQKDLAAVVYRAKLPDGAPEVISDAGYGAGALAIDATRVFFRSGSNTFSALEKTGGAAPRTFDAGDTPFVLQPFDETVFVISFDALRQVDLASGASEKRATLDRSQGMVRLGSSICYLDTTSGDENWVVAYDTALKTTTRLFPYQNLGDAIATDGRDVFIDTAETNEATVLRFRKGDAAPTAIASGVNPPSLAVDDRYVYVASGTKLGRVDKNR